MVNHICLVASSLKLYQSRSKQCFPRNMTIWKRPWVWYLIRIPCFKEQVKKKTLQISEQNYILHKLFFDNRSTSCKFNFYTWHVQKVGDPDITPQEINAVEQPHQEDIAGALPPQEDIADVLPPLEDNPDVLPLQEDIEDILPQKNNANVHPPQEDTANVFPPLEDIVDVLPPLEGHANILPPPDGFPDDVQRNDEFASEKEIEILATSTREFLNSVEEVCDEEDDEFFTYFSTGLVF